MEARYTHPIDLSKVVTLPINSAARWITGLVDSGDGVRSTFDPEIDRLATLGLGGENEGVAGDIAKNTAVGQSLKWISLW